MPQQIEVYFINKRQVIEKTNLSHANIYRRINAGIFPKQVKFGPKKSVWPKHEIDEICLAMLKGASNEDLRALVADLHSQRGV